MGIVIENFARGWQNKARRELMNSEALYVCEDLALDRLGALKARRLHVEQSYFDAQTLTSEIEDVFIVDVEGAGRYLILYRVGSTLYCWDSSTAETRTLSSGMSGEHVSYAPLKPVLSDFTYVYVTDGRVLLCDNGVTTKTWGIDAPTGLPLVSMAGSGGSLEAGDYVYAYTFYDADTGSESDPSIRSATTTAAANDEATVSDIETSSNSRVTKRRVYRTLVDGGTMYLVEALNNNTVTKYVDDTADDNLTTELETDQGTPPSGDVVVSFKERLFMAGVVDYPNRVWFSRAARPDNWPSTYYLDVGTSNDKVLNLIEFEGKLYFIQRASLAGLYGSDSDTFAWHKTRSHVGTSARWSAAAGPDGIYFVGHDGVYRFDGLKSVRVSDAIDRSFGLTPDDWNEVVDAGTVEDVARGCFLFGVYYVRLPMKAAGGTVTNRILAYDTFEQTWRLLKVDTDSLFSDVGRGKLYGSMERPDDSGKYSVYELFSVDSSSVDSSSPEFVTKSFEVVGQDEGRGRAVSWLRRFRVDCVGAWTLYFYVDGTLVHTETLTGQSETTRYQWYDLPPQTKGRYFFVRATATGDAEPETTIFNALEVE